MATRIEKPLGRDTVTTDGVEMSIDRGMRLRHVSDTPSGWDSCFGGDTMGQWNVGRINRMLDGFNAPIVRFRIPRANMEAMALVGAPDRERVQRYAALPLATMPPLTYVTLPGPALVRDGLTTLLVDGHHRMAVLALLNADEVPARVLPPMRADDVRIVEMSELIVFPEPTFGGKRVRTGGHR